VNDAATGAPVILNAPVEDEAVTIDTSSIADADGLGAFSYQWQASADGITWTDIIATESSFVPTDLLLNGFADPASVKLRVNVSFTDGLGTLETLTSEASADIVPFNDGTADVTVVGPVAGTFNVGDTFTASLSARSGQYQPAGCNSGPSSGCVTTSPSMASRLPPIRCRRPMPARSSPRVRPTPTRRALLKLPETWIGDFVQAPATGLPTINITNANNGATVGAAERRVFTAVTARHR